MAKKRGEVDPPETLSPQELGQLTDWALRNGITRAALDWGIETVLLWGRSNGHRKLDWVATIQGGIRRGWALEGFAGIRRRSQPVQLSLHDQREKDYVDEQRRRFEADPASPELRAKIRARWGGRRAGSAPLRRG